MCTYITHLPSACSLTSRASATPSVTSRSTLTATPISNALLSRRFGASPGARSSHTASWLPWPGTRTLSVPPGRSARTTDSRSSSRVTASSRRPESGAMARAASSTSVVCSSSKMSFSEDVRNELAAIAPERECDRQAELSALFHSAGRWHMRRGEVSVHLDVAESAVARRAFSLLRSFGVASEIRTYQRRAFDGATRYQLHVAGDEHALQVLHEAGVLSSRLTPLASPPRRVVARSCCRGAYLRGALLGGGSLSGPRSPHLELRTAELDGADFLARIAAEEGLQLGVVERGRHALAYAKGAETIAGVLALAGAGRAVLLFEESAVISATRS